MDSLDLEALDGLLETTFVGRWVIYRSSLESTQDLARSEAEGDAPQGTLVVADEQTAGRGRQGRSWLSPRGTNLYFTLVLRPSLEQLARLSMITPVAVAEGIEAATPLVCGIKWPNDVFVQGKKISGILLDSEVEGNNPRYALAGIGINVNFDPRPLPEIAGTATSVLAETGATASRETVLAGVLNAFEERYLASVDSRAVFTVWRNRLVNLRQQVTIHDSDGATVEGFAESVNENGSLVLRLNDGAVREFPAGHLTLS